MKESKFNYTAVRIYNTELATNLEEAFRRAETSFAANRSAFLVHLIELGFSDYMREIDNKRQNPIAPTLDTPTDIEDLQDLLDEYILYSRTVNEKSQEKLETCEGLASAILNILLDSIDGKFVDREAAEAGKYDDLPRRFMKGNGKD